MPRPISSNPVSASILYNLLVHLNNYLIGIHYMLGSELGDEGCSKSVYRLIGENVILSFLFCFVFC